MATAAKKTQPEEPDNLAIWHALCKTDPKHTKPFKRAGGFKGTAIKPIWIVQRLTERFGPCGIGWGVEKPDYQLVHGENKELLVYCTIAGWYIEGEQRAAVYGVGGDKAITYIKANEEYNRPERWENDDEAFKKAFTDALGNAFKFLGIGADVHMGQFEDSKYVRETAQEFAAGPPANDSNGKKETEGPFPPGPAKNKTELKAMMRELWREVEGCGDVGELDALLMAKPNVALTTQLIKALPEWWEGRSTGNMPFEGLEHVIRRKRDEFDLAAQAEPHPFSGG